MELLLNGDQALNGSPIEELSQRLDEVVRCWSQMMSLLFGLATPRVSSTPLRSLGVVLGSIHLLISAWPSAKLMPPALL
jgi:hypothetical protein